MRRTVAERARFCEGRALEMRRAPTPQERKLRERLKPLGFQFQVHVGGYTKNRGRWDYILDCVRTFPHWPAADRQMLCVEVDGEQHAHQGRGRDRRRGERLRQQGIVTLRFANARIDEDLDAVVAEIKAALDARPEDGE